MAKIYESGRIAKKRITIRNDHISDYLTQRFSTFLFDVMLKFSNGWKILIDFF